MDHFYVLVSGILDEVNYKKVVYKVIIHLGIRKIVIFLNDLDVHKDEKIYLVDPCYEVEEDTIIYSIDDKKSII